MIEHKCTEGKRTCVIIFGSMNSGKRSTANKERDVNALAGVKSPPSKVNIPNETTITTTGMLFRMKLFNCKICKISMRFHFKRKERKAWW